MAQDAGLQQIALGLEGTIQLMDQETGALSSQIDVAENSVTALAFSPDGTFLLSAQEDGTPLSPDGTQFAAGFGTFRFVAQGNYLDNSIRLWDIATGEETARLEGHEDAVVSLANDPTGRYLFSGSIDTSLRLWELVSGTMVRRFDGHSSGVMSIAFSPDGRFAASGSQDGTLIVWEVESGELIRQIRGHEGGVHFVGFSADGENIWSGAEDGGINLWRPFLSPAALDTWIVDNRYIPTLPCDQRLL